MHAIVDDISLRSVVRYEFRGGGSEVNVMVVQVAGPILTIDDCHSQNKIHPTDVRS